MVSVAHLTVYQIYTYVMYSIWIVNIFFEFRLSLVHVFMERKTEYIKTHRKKTEIPAYVLPIDTSRKRFFEQTKERLAGQSVHPCILCIVCWGYQCLSKLRCMYDASNSR